MANPLERWIREQLGQRGPVPFERFMDWALYHARHGFYTSGQVGIGRDTGDFTTAPHTSPLFARCVANLVRRVDAALDRPSPLTVLEGGPGEGRLARDLLDLLADRDRALYERIHYVLVERSPALAERQRELLAGHAARIGTTVPEEPAAGLFFSNELVDAFPVHRLVVVEGRLREVYVKLEGEELTEELGPPSDPELESAYAAEGVTLPDGCAFEVNLRLENWVAEVAATLDRGYLVTVDYGDEFRSLYGPQRPQGTVAGYRRHRLCSDLLAAPGDQDLTAHANFSALRRTGERCGLNAAPLLQQRDFLFATGLVEEMARLEELQPAAPEVIALRRSVAPLLMPAGHGTGETFKVLVQAKDAALAPLRLQPMGASTSHPE